MQNARERILIAPSLLAADFTHIGREVGRVQRSGADWLHLDIMDGHFVPNISFGPAMVKAIRPLSKLVFDVHLMCDRPEILLDRFAEAGADRLTIHAELPQKQVSDLIWKIRSMGKQVGLSLNPATSMQTVEPFLRNVNSLLIMTVVPGFGGQSFIRETLTKIQQAHAWRTERDFHYEIAVDGGINFETAAECAHAGANAFISGTALFGQANMGAAVRKMRALAQKSFPTEQAALRLS